MNVVRHDNVSADGNIEVALSSLGKKNKRGVNFVTSQPCSPVMRAISDKIEWARVEN
jgi:hypothetical protein